MKKVEFWKSIFIKFGRSFRSKMSLKILKQLALNLAISEY